MDTPLLDGIVKEAGVKNRFLQKMMGKGNSILDKIFARSNPLKPMWGVEKFAPDIAGRTMLAGSQKLHYLPGDPAKYVNEAKKLMGRSGDDIVRIISKNRSSLTGKNALRRAFGSRDFL